MNELINDTNRMQKNAYNYLYEEIESYFIHDSSDVYKTLNSIEKRDTIINKIISVHFTNCNEEEKEDIVIYLKSNYFGVLKNQKNIFENMKENEEEEKPKIDWWRVFISFWIGFFGWGEISKLLKNKK